MEIGRLKNDRLEFFGLENDGLQIGKYTIDWPN